MYSVCICSWWWDVHTCIYFISSVVFADFLIKSSFKKNVEFEQINVRSIANFKNSISNADIISKLDVEHSANPNVNYNILTDIITTTKANHIFKRIIK